MSKVSVMLSGRQPMKVSFGSVDVYLYSKMSQLINWFLSFYC